MHAIKTFTLLAIAGSALAAPWGEGKYWSHGGDNQGTVSTEIATATAYTTVTAASDVAAQVATSTAAATTSSASQTQATSSTTATSSATSTATSSSSSSSDYMSVVSEWRSKMGLAALTESDTLQANALKTVTDGDGQLVHELNSGTLAQVLAPGNADNFEDVFVGGWLCEEPSLPGLDGICTTLSVGWDYDGQTGHAEILSSTSYTEIGCALYDGVWGCDLA